MGCMESTSVVDLPPTKPEAMVTSIRRDKPSKPVIRTVEEYNNAIVDGNPDMDAKYIDYTSKLRGGLKLGRGLGDAGLVGGANCTSAVFGGGGGCGGGGCGGGGG